MGSSDPVVIQSRHVLTAGAEMRATLTMAGAWGDRRIDLGHTPIYVLTNGEPPPIPGATEEEKKAASATWIALHAELLAASSSEVRRHIIITGASHYLHRTHPAAVADAARELVERLRAQPATGGP
jgi:pimeloyl-ACP methyl ester carboxylesterase